MASEAQSPAQKQTANNPAKGREGKTNGNSNSNSKPADKS